MDARDLDVLLDCAHRLGVEALGDPAPDTVRVALRPSLTPGCHVAEILWYGDVVYDSQEIDGGLAPTRAHALDALNRLLGRAVPDARAFGQAVRDVEAAWDAVDEERAG